MTDNTASTLDGWPVPAGLPAQGLTGGGRAARPAPRTNRRRWPFVVAGVVALFALAVYLLWPYIVGAVLIAFAWKVMTR